MDQPSIFREDLWSQQHKRLVELLTLALTVLEEGEQLPEGPEEEITRRLALCCGKVEYQLEKEGHPITGTLLWEAKNLPQYRDTRVPVRGAKVPDCQYQFRDQQASGPEDYQKSLTIECKRLGQVARSSQTRKLNRDYVREGVCRFRDYCHSYGRSAPCGIMIGYVQNMGLDDILGEVNVECVGKCIAELTLSEEGWQPGLTTVLNHVFDRPFSITPFALRHMWSDLRRHYADKRV